MALTMKPTCLTRQRSAVGSTSVSTSHSAQCRPCSAFRRPCVSARALPEEPAGGEEDLTIGRFGIPEPPPEPEPERFYGVKGYMFTDAEGNPSEISTTPVVAFDSVDMLEIKPPPERFEGLGGFVSADGSFVSGQEGYLGVNASTGTLLASGKAPEPQKQDLKPQAEEEAVKGLKGYKSVFVAGATGGVGRRVVEALHAEGVPVRALVRDYSKGGELPGLSTSTTLVKGDVTQFATLAAAIGDADAVVVATGASGITDPLGPFNVDYQGTLNLIALARQKGVKKFVLVTSIGTDDILNPLNLFYGVLFWKKRAEEELQRSGLDYTIIRPGVLLPINKAFGLPLPMPMHMSDGSEDIQLPGGFTLPNPFGFPTPRQLAAKLPSRREVASKLPNRQDSAEQLPRLSKRLPDRSEVAENLPDVKAAATDLANQLPDPKEVAEDLSSRTQAAASDLSARTQAAASDVYARLPKEVSSRLPDPKDVADRMPKMPSSGGLKNNLRAGESAGNVVMAPPNTYGVPPLRTAGSILRKQVAEVCVAALGEESASNKVVEIIADKDAMPRSYEDLFSSVSMAL